MQSRGNLIRRRKKVLFSVKSLMYDNYDGVIIIMESRIGVSNLNINNERVIVYKYKLVTLLKVNREESHV